MNKPIIMICFYYLNETLIHSEDYSPAKHSIALDLNKTIEKNDYVNCKYNLYYVSLFITYFLFNVIGVFSLEKKEITRLWTSLKPFRKTRKINLGSFVFE